jgi:hypothetical protein
MGARSLQFVAIVLTAVYLIPGGAHLFALPNKIGMPREDYFTAQAIYLGWWMFGFVLFGAIAADAALAFALRARRPAFIFAVAALLLMLANLAIFFTWTFPANQATVNWTEVPENWEALRAEWEYSHAINAGISFLSLCCVTLAALADRD